MSAVTPVAIDLTQKFPHLPAAPIVEAVIHWHARATSTWEPEKLKTELATRLHEYPKSSLQHQHELIFETPFGDNQEQPSASHHTTWQGIRMQSENKPYIAQFTRDGLVFSRLQPYEDWERFSTEARRLWKLFVELAQPKEIERLGVRYINRIPSAEFGNLHDYFREPPSFLDYWSMNGFFYQSTFEVPGHALGVRIIKTIQPVPTADTDKTGLILDIDVFTRKSLPCEDRVLDDYLPKMRWLKNKVFFDLLKPQAIKSFQEGQS
jgi:uncharacterized protein (TIGR04255 family)